MTQEFDFNTAIAEARRDYPDETENVTFINLSLPDALDQLQTWFTAASPEYQKIQFRSSADRQRRDIQLKLEGGGFVTFDPFTGKYLLAMPTRNPPMYGHWSASQEAQYVFDHELGHIVPPGGILERNKADAYKPRPIINRQEATAESFSVLRGLRRGTMTVDDIRALSMERALFAAQWPVQLMWRHMVSQALDKIVADSENVDFKALSPQKIAELAGCYGQLSPDEVMFDQMEIDLNPAKAVIQARFFRQVPKGLVGRGLDFFRCKTGLPVSSDVELQTGPRTRYIPLTTAEWMENLADICTYEEPGSFRFSIVTKILSHALDTGALPRCHEEQVADVTGERMDKIRQQLAQCVKAVSKRNPL